MASSPDTLVADLSPLGGVMEQPEETSAVLLAIDTSTALASVALSRRNRILGETTWQAGQHHARQLLPQVQTLLHLAGLTPSDLGVIAVATGPGSFNGLRVGLSTAKGLAFALALPLVGIGTLDVLAYQHAETRIQICPLLNAGRGEWAYALYRAGARQLRRITPYALLKPPDLVRLIDRVTLFCGEVSGEVMDALSEGLGAQARFVARAAEPRRAGFLADLAGRYLARHRPSDLAQLQPIYLRRPAVTGGEQCRS